MASTPGRFHGKVAIVTGAARGIGRSAAIAMARGRRHPRHRRGRKRGGGRIIIASSTRGQHGTKWGSAYSATKRGLIGLMKSAALELGETKITVELRRARPHRHAADPPS